MGYTGCDKMIATPRKNTSHLAGAKPKAPSCREFNSALGGAYPAEVSAIARKWRRRNEKYFQKFGFLIISSFFKMSFDTEEARLIDRIQATAFFQAREAVGGHTEY